MDVAIALCNRDSPEPIEIFGVDSDFAVKPGSFYVGSDRKHDPFAIRQMRGA